jgi:hypothetical protein
MTSISSVVPRMLKTAAVVLFTKSVSMHPALGRRRAFASCIASPGMWIVSSVIVTQIAADKGEARRWTRASTTGGDSPARHSTISSMMDVATGSVAYLSQMEKMSDPRTATESGVKTLESTPISARIVSSMRYSVSPDVWCMRGFSNAKICCEDCWMTSGGKYRQKLKGLVCNP